jgi:hypothetical protein
MPLLGEHVTPVLPRRGRCSLFFLLGSGWGVFFTWLSWSPMSSWTYFGWSEATWRIILQAIPVLAWAALWTRFEQRAWVSARLGAVFGLGVIVGTVGWSAFTMPGLGYDENNWWGPLVVGGPILALVGAIVGAGLAALARFGVLQAVVQPDPPRLCWKCGYDLGLPLAPRCTECGTPPGRVRPRARGRFALLSGLVRSAPVALALAIVTIGSLAAYRAAKEIPPLRAFDRRFAGAEPVSTYIDLDLAKTAGRGVYSYTRAVGRLLTQQDSSGRRYQVSFTPSPRRDPDDPAMQVRVAMPAPPPFPGFDALLTDWGLVTVVADLDDEQARRVLRDGLPPGLLEALSARADTIGWRPMNATGSPGKREVVDPGPFFPPVVDGPRAE